MRPKKERDLEYYSDIYIDVYVIGYSYQGESILFVLYANKPHYKVLYSIVIDCYKENFNATKELLNEILMPKQKIDMLVWTHPHDDHTKGIIELFDNYCSKDTKIILANILGTKIYELSDECQKFERKITNLNKSLKIKYDINDMVHFDEELKSITYYSADAIENMSIRCIAPIPSINAKQSSKKKINLNDICVAIIIEIQLKNEKKLNFMFSGDIENEVLSELGQLKNDYAIPSTYNLIKIPHHGGRSGEKIKDILNEDCKSEYAITTIYRKNDKGKSTNPDMDLIKEYKKYIKNIGCTSDIINKRYGMGIIRINYPLQVNSKNLNEIIDKYGYAIDL